MEYVFPAVTFGLVYRYTRTSAARHPDPGSALASNYSGTQRAREATLYVLADVWRVRGEAWLGREVYTDRQQGTDFSQASIPPGSTSRSDGGRSTSGSATSRQRPDSFWVSATSTSDVASLRTTTDKALPSVCPSVAESAFQRAPGLPVHPARYDCVRWQYRRRWRRVLRRPWPHLLRRRLLPDCYRVVRAWGCLFGVRGCCFFGLKHPTPNLERF